MSSVNDLSKYATTSAKLCSAANDLQTASRAMEGNDALTLNHSTASHYQAQADKYLDIASILKGIKLAAEAREFCEVYIYKDLTSRMRHVGFLLQFPYDSYTIDYGLVKSPDIGGTYGYKNLKNKDLKTCKLHDIDTRTKRQYLEFIKLIEDISSQYSETYSVTDSGNNCRGFVLRHIKTFCDRYNISSKCSDEAVAFIDETIKEDRLLVNMAQTTLKVASSIVGGVFGYYTGMGFLAGLDRGYKIGTTVGDLTVKYPKVMQLMSSVHDVPDETPDRINMSLFS